MTQVFYFSPKFNMGSGEKINSVHFFPQMCIFSPGKCVFFPGGLKTPKKLPQNTPFYCRVILITDNQQFGPGRQNTTVLATICADGSAMDPFIVFQGQRMQVSWKGNTPKCPKTDYGVSENRWMASELFEAWFTKVFVKHVKDKVDGPAILIFDGHASHLSLNVVQVAKDNDITILKLPAKTTDTLQPLDVACFKPLKEHWDRTVQWLLGVTGGTAYVATSTFASVLSEVWRLGLTEENNKSGFVATGIYPVDSSKYPANKLDPELVSIYNEWLADGKPMDDEGMPDLSKWDDEPEVEVTADHVVEPEGDGAAEEPAPDQPGPSGATVRRR